jgi:serine/threonine protein kinase
MTILGKRVKFEKSHIMAIFKDLCYTVKQMHEKLVIMLALNPNNIVFNEEKSYSITDAVFNSVTAIWLEKLGLENECLELDGFPEFLGKKEHSVCVFDGGYETVTQIKRSRKKKRVWSAYEAPEIVEEIISPVDYSEAYSKADVFSLAVLIWFVYICFRWFF